MDGKIEFGCDFLYICRELQARDKNPRKMFSSDAAARFFLLLWDFTVEEVDEANELYWSRFNDKKLDEPLDVIERIASHIGDDQALQKQLITHLSAIGYMDYDITEDEWYFVKFLSDKFDLRPSEFNEYSDKGGSLAVGLNFFGDQYMEMKTQK